MEKRTKQGTVLTAIIFLQLILCFMFVPVSNVVLAEEIRYAGSKEAYVMETVDIIYDELVITKHQFEDLMPTYQEKDFVLFPNNCANVAGANIIGYWDRYYPNLIPNFIPIFDFFGDIEYKRTSNEVTAMCRSLYTHMDTNVGGAGTTYGNFVSGMKDYVSDQGYDISITNTPFTETNYDNLSNQISNGIPVVLFLTKFAFMDKWLGFDQISDTQLRYNKKVYSIGHLVCVLGIYEYNFYLNNQLIRTDRFIATADSWGDLSLILVDDDLIFNHSIAMRIY